MRKLAVCELTFGSGYTFQEEVDEIARLGIPAITLQGAKAEKLGLKRARQIVRDAGLKVSGYGGGGWFTLPGELKRRVEDGKRRIEEAAELEADFLLVKAGPRGSLTYDEASRLHLDGMRQIAPAARASGVQLAVEPSHPIFAFNSFIVTLRDALDLAKQVEGTGVVLDTFHSWWDPRVLGDIKKDCALIYNVQISDYAKSDQPVVLTTGGPRVALGEGMIPFKEIFHALDTAGYKRYYDIEVIGSFTPARQKALVADCKKYFEALWR